MLYFDDVAGWTPDQTAPAATTTQVTTPPPPSLLSRSWGSIADAAKYVGSEIANPTPATESEDGPGVGKQFAEGVVHGTADILHPPAAWLADKFGVGDGNAVQRTQQWQKDFTDKYGDSTAASIGRAVGQTMITAPVMSGVGGLAARGISTVAPELAPALELLSGSMQGNLATRAASLASQGALTGAASGAMTAGPDQSITDAALRGGVTGAIAGPAIGAATYPLRAAVGRVANMVDPDLAGWAKKAADYGVEIDPSKLTTNPTYKLIADQLGKLPLSGVDEVAQRRNWQGAVAKLFGEDTDKGITYDVMGRAAKRIGPGMDAITGRNAITDPTVLGQLQTDLGGIATDMKSLGMTPEQKARLGQQFSNIADAVQNGQIGGKAYQNLTQTGSALDRTMAHTDPEIGGFASRINAALSKAMQASMSPEDAAAYGQLQGQYRALKTVQPLVEQRGAMGDINPAALQARVIAQSRKFDPSTGGVAYTGGGQIGDLANIGKIFFSPQADSGTPARNIVLGSILGGGGVSALMGHPLAAASVAGGLVANRAIQTLMHSPGVGRVMIEGSVNPASRGAQFSNVPLVSGATNLLGIGTQPQ